MIERLEARVRAAVPELRSVHTHIEPLSRHRLGARAPAAGRHGAERAAVEETVRGITGAPPAAVRFRDAERGRVALVTIMLPGEQPLPVGPPPRGPDRGGGARALPRASPT